MKNKVTILILPLLLLSSAGAFADGTFNINDGSVTITESGAYTITGTTNTNTITVTGYGTVADITIQDVSIDVSSIFYVCAFSIESGATVSLTLSGTNVLQSGYSKAGLEVPNDAILTITGTSGDKLEATGGHFGSGIGGSDWCAVGTITINGGTITAVGNGGGSGIGGGFAVSGGVTTINGGTVIATSNSGGGDSAAGIGSGGDGHNLIDGGNITITGGTVTATGGDWGADIGGGFESAGGSVTISGGSINATIQSQPTDGQGNNVYLNILTVGVSDESVTAGSINEIDCDETPDAAAGVYGINDIKTDGAGEVYFYLTASADEELVKLTVDGTFYEKAYKREANNSNAQILTLVAPYGISLNKAGTHTFAEETYGYPLAPTALTVIVTNTGTNATGNLTVGLSGSHAGSFSSLSGTSISSIAVDGTGSFTVVPNTGLSVGTYTATVTVSSSAHSINESFDVEFTVTQKAITVTPDANQSKLYGQSDPALTYACIPALIAGDEFAGSLSRAAGENLGTYLIEQGTLELSNNYDLTFTTGVLFTINPTNPRLLQDLEDVIVCVGESHTFEIVAEGENLSYEWYYGNERIKGANGNTYTITNAEFRDYERYYVIVRSQIGSYRSSIYSKNVRLWVADQLPESLQFVEFPSPVITGKTYRIKLAGYPDVTQYAWDYSNDGVTFSPATGGVGQNETLATFGALSKGTGVLKATLTHPCGTREATQTIRVNYPTGIEEVTVNEIAVSPNPTQGIIKVSGTKSNQIIRVVDIIGSLKGTYPTQDGETTIDLTGYNKGTYLIQYNDKTVKAIKK